MNKLFLFAAGVAVFAMTTAFAPRRGSPLEGKWFGEYATDSNVVQFETRFWSGNDGVKGTIDVPREGIFDAELEWIMIDSTSVHFELVRDSGTLVFDGELKDNRVSGEFKKSVDRGIFTLSRGSLVAQ